MFSQVGGLIPKRWRTLEAPPKAQPLQIRWEPPSGACELHRRCAQRSHLMSARSVDGLLAHASVGFLAVVVGALAGTLPARADATAVAAAAAALPRNGWRRQLLGALS